MADKYKTFSANLNEALCRKKLSPIEFAKKLNISKQQMTKYLQGKAIPRQTRLNTIAHRLDVSPSWLLGTEEKVSNDRDTYKKDEEKAQKLVKVLDTVIEDLSDNQNTGESGTFDPAVEEDPTCPKSNVPGNIKMKDDRAVIETDNKNQESLNFTVDRALDLLESLDENITIGQYVRLRLIVDALTDSIKDK